MRCIVKPGYVEGNILIYDPKFEEKKRYTRRHTEMTSTDEFIKHIQFMDYRPYISAIITDDGDPVSVAGTPAYYLDDALLDDLPKRQQKDVMRWIDDNFYVRKTPNYNYHTYWLKHALQYETGIYITDNQMKDAFLRAGFEPLDKYEETWKFCLGVKNQTRLEKIHAQGRYLR